MCIYTPGATIELKLLTPTSNQAKGDTMQLTYLFTWRGSAGGNCPAVYDTDAGDLVVQGYNLSTDEASQLRNVAGDESGVRIPFEMAEQIADMVIARRA